MNAIAGDYAGQKLQVLSINLWESWATIQNYQNNNPNILFLRDAGSVWNIYKQNSYIPLNYVITPEQTVDFFMEGFTESLIRNHIENLLPEVTIVLTFNGDPVPQGGVLSFNATLHNWEDTAQTVYALTQVTLPGGTRVNLLGPLPVTVNPNDEISVNLHHNIPMGAPLGAYQYEAKIGTYPPVDLMDSSHFEFEVVAP